MESKKILEKEWMSTSRIQTLTDGIFAIAMTLLVLNLEVPDFPSSVTDAEFSTFLIGMIPKFYVYGLSFILLAVFWRINHAQFHVIKKADMGLIRINILWLLFVALVPFSTILIGEYGELPSAALFFNSNMFIIGVLSFINWYYSYKKDLTSTDKSSRTFRRYMGINLMFPISALLAMGVSFYHPSLSTVVYATIPFIKYLDNVLQKNMMMENNSGPDINPALMLLFNQLSHTRRDHLH